MSDLSSIFCRNTGIRNLKLNPDTVVYSIAYLLVQCPDGKRDQISVFSVILVARQVEGYGIILERILDPDPPPTWNSVKKKWT